MIRVTVMYPNDGGKFDVEYYLSKHIALCHKLLDSCGMLKIEVDRGIGSAQPGAPAPYQIITQMVFRSLEDLQKALATHDPALAADVPNFTTIQPQLQISEILTKPDYSPPCWPAT